MVLVVLFAAGFLLVCFVVLWFVVVGLVAVLRLGLLCWFRVALVAVVLLLIGLLWFGLFIVASGC